MDLRNNSGQCSHSIRIKSRCPGSGPWRPVGESWEVWTWWQLWLWMTGTWHSDVKTHSKITTVGLRPAGVGQVCGRDRGVCVTSFLAHSFLGLV